MLMGSVFFPLLKNAYAHSSFVNTDNSGFNDEDRSAELAWRTVFIIPAIMAFIMSFYCMEFTDDCPKGDYRKRIKTQEISYTPAYAALINVLSRWNVWVLFLQYACCFGVETTMINGLALYFKEEYDLTTEQAAAIASVFGFINLFARGMGGYTSDTCMEKYGMRGRVYCQGAMLLCQAAAIMLLAYADTLALAIAAVIVLSIFVQSAEGSTFGIVPYVDRKFTGAAVGYIGAGGNVGGVILSAIFREYDYRHSFVIMAIITAVGGLLSLFIKVDKLVVSLS